jgi:metal-responsive CopG/Arc/MetJ family transcriptional regulator
MLMATMTKMGRPKLGKVAYQFTCPPDLLTRFDAIAADMGLTRSDLLVTLIRERVEKHDRAERKGK